MKKSLIGSLAAVAAASLVLAGCGSSNDGGDTTAPPAGEATDTATEGEGGGEAGGDVSGTISFAWWGNDDRADKYEQSVALFKEKYPDVEVQTSWQAFPDYWTARNTEAAGSALPDVFQFDSAFLREYAESGRLLDLAPFISSGAIDLSGYDAGLVEAGNLGGQQVAIPTSTNTLAMFVNPTVVDQTGVEFPADGYTWDDLNTFIQATYDAGVKNSDGFALYGSGDYTGTFWLFLQWLIQNGTDPFTDDGQLNFTQDDIKSFFALSADLREAGSVYPVERGVALAPLGGFTMNESAAEMSWDNFLSGYVADSGVEDIQVVPIPSGPNGTGNFFRPSMHLTAGANTENPDAAAALINFLLTDPEVGAIFGTSKGVPADANQRAAVNAEEGSIDARVLAYEELIGATETTTAPIPVKGFGTIEEKWRQLAEEIHYEYITVDEFVDQWWSEAQRAIAEGA